MSTEPDRLTLLQRIDLTLATHAVQGLESAMGPDRWQPPWLSQRPEWDAQWVAGALALRGFKVAPEVAADVLDGGLGRHLSSNQEIHLIRGLGRVLRAVRVHASAGLGPDGGFMAELFGALTTGIARFRNNILRRDLPWDGLPLLQYPKPGDLEQLLAGFSPAARFGEEPAFDRVHPVRQSLRVLWRLARIAPFPDFNLLMAFVAMNVQLAARGYPLISADPGDRALLERLVSGPAPRRLVQLESRLLAELDRAATP